MAEGKRRAEAHKVCRAVRLLADGLIRRQSRAPCG